MNLTKHRAAEILDPNHREHYESIDPVNEACRMGREAILRSIPDSVIVNGDASTIRCPNCGADDYLHNLDGAEMRFCGYCGQALDWSEPNE